MAGKESFVRVWLWLGHPCIEKVVRVFIVWFGFFFTMSYEALR